MNLTDGFLHIKEAAKSVGLTVVSVRMHGDGGQYRVDVVVPLLLDPPSDDAIVSDTAQTVMNELALRFGGPFPWPMDHVRKPLTQDDCRVDRPPDLRTKRGPGRPRKAQSLG